MNYYKIEKILFNFKKLIFKNYINHYSINYNNKNKTTNLIMVLIILINKFNKKQINIMKIKKNIKCKIIII